MAVTLKSVGPFLNKKLGGETAEVTGSAEEIIYSRGASDLTISAMAGRGMLFAVSNPSGAARVVRGDADWFFAAALLEFDGQATIPLKGDTITVVRDSITEVYEVTTPTGEDVFRYCDSQNRRIRVHTMRVG